MVYNGEGNFPIVLTKWFTNTNFRIIMGRGAKVGHTVSVETRKKIAIAVSKANIGKHKLALDILKKLQDKDWLYHQRFVLKKSKDTIAFELGCSVIPINKWIKIH